MTSVPWSNWPLPVGWEMKYEQSQRRYFYINHSTKTTSWEDPRKVLWEQQQHQQQQHQQQQHQQQQHQQQQHQQQQQWQRTNPPTASAGGARIEHIPMTDLSRRDLSPSPAARRSPSPMPYGLSPVSPATRPAAAPVTQQQYTPAPAMQQKYSPAPSPVASKSPRPAAASAKPSTSVSHGASSSASHPPPAAAHLLDEPVELSNADKDRVRMRLRGEFSKFDTDIFEMALEATNFDEARSRALLKSLSEETATASRQAAASPAASAAASAAAAAPTAPHPPVVATSHASLAPSIPVATSSHLDVTMTTTANVDPPSQRRSPSPSNKPSVPAAVSSQPVVTLSSAVDSSGSRSNVAGGQRSRSPSVPHSSQSVASVTPAAPLKTVVTAPFHHKTVAVAANRSLAHGHDKSLLIKDYVPVSGPNPEHHHGPNLDLRHGPTGAVGPDPSLRHGPHFG